MSETTERKKPVRRIRHKGRGSQVIIYLGKQLRFFINQNDWKVLPMAAIIAALVSMVIKNKFFFNMEGSMMGAFSLTCVAIWNGCFNSIQAVCRERAIIKREHRSGMHITSYVAAHMIYQLFLCIGQTALTLYVLRLMDVYIPEKGFMTPYMIVDLGITLLLVSYASDMLSLFISSISHTTTGAMTIMPFVLIFQLVFSGGIIPLPEWSKKMSDYTISNYGIKAIAAQSGYNEVPMETAWKTLVKLRDNEVGGTVSLGQILDVLQSEPLKSRRDMKVLDAYTVGQVAEALQAAESSLHLRDKEVSHVTTGGALLEEILTNQALKNLRDKQVIAADGDQPAVTVGNVVRMVLDTEDLKPLLDRKIGATLTLGQVLDALQAERIAALMSDTRLNDPVTLGDIIDFAATNKILKANRDRTFTVKVRVGDLFDMYGEEELQDLVRRKTAEVSRNPDYDRTEENVISYWTSLALFILLFALLATISLELIDKDKR